MILLDTNVVSEVMRRAPSPTVLEWLDRQAAETLYLSSVTVAEISLGLRAHPAGARQRRLAETADRILALFAGRTLPFDTGAARYFADLAFRARVAGRGLPTPDGYIAAIAAARGLTVATRDIAPFAAAGIHVIDPWSQT